jgi:hypothetical protein
VIDARSIKNVYLVSDEQRASIAKHADAARGQIRKGAFRNTYKDRDSELAGANIEESRNLRPPKESLGRPFVEDPVVLPNGLPLKKGTRVRFASGATAVAKEYRLHPPELADQYHGGKRHALQVSSVKGTLPTKWADQTQESARHNQFGEDVVAVYDKATRKWVEAGGGGVEFTLPGATEGPHAASREGPEELTPEAAAKILEGRGKPGELRLVDEPTADDDLESIIAGVQAEGAPPPGAAIDPTQIVPGRPDLANPMISEPARRLQDAVDTMRSEAGQPETVHDVDVQAAASKRLADDYEGEKARLIKAGKTSTPFNAEDALVANELIEREAMGAMLKGSVSDVRDVMILSDGVRTVRAEMGRAFRQLRDRVMTPEQRRASTLSEALLTPPPGKTIDQWAKDFAGIKRRLKKRGIDIGDIVSVAQDPVATARTLNDISAAKGTFWGALEEYWRNSVLSFPQTHAVNITSNAAHAGYSFAVERTIEALVNAAVIKNPNAAQLGELKYIWKGMMPGLARGWRNFFRSIATGRPYFEESLGREGGTKIEGRRGPQIPGAFGEGIRVPQTFLQAADEFFKSTIAEMDVGAQAYRIAKREGLKGTALTRRMEELTLDLQSEAWDKALETAHEYTFQEEPGAIAKGLVKMREGFYPLRFPLQFVKTIANIFRQGARKSGLSAFKAIGVAAKGPKGKDWDKLPKYIGEALVAAGAIAAVMVGNDEEDPIITGAAGYRERGKRSESYRTGRRRMSVKIGKWWVPYDRIEPFSTWIAMAVDVGNAIKRGDIEELPATALDSIVTQAQSKTFMRGISDILNVMEAENIPEGGLEWLSNFASSWVPNIARGTARETQETFKERRVSLEQGSYFERAGKAALKRTELGLIEEEPSYNVWGQKAMRPGQPAALTSLPWRIVNFIDPVMENIPDRERIILNWNMDNPDEPYVPSKPGIRYQTPDGKKHTMTAKEYAQYSRIAGQFAMRKIDSWIESGRLNVAHPAARDIKMMRMAFTEGRKKAKLPLLRQWAVKRKSARANGERPIDTSLPVIDNPDGSFSTERTKTFEIDGEHYIIPTIVNGKQVSDREAIDYAMKHKLWIGKFKTAAQAERVAKARSKRIGELRGRTR